MRDGPNFDRLVETANLIVRHPDYPDKLGAIDQCGQEIEELIEAGRLTDSQADLLRSILGIPHQEGSFWSNRPDKSELKTRPRASSPI